MAPAYKLTYFDSTGRAEAARLLFVLAGVEFEDNRLDSEGWQKFKPQTPFGQLPVLEVDGTMVAQSNAIYRFIANEFGLAGKNSLEKARADMVVDGFGDLFSAMVAYYVEKDDEKKATLKKKLSDEQMPVFFQQWEKFVDSESGFFLKSGMSWADVVFACTMDLIASNGVPPPFDRSPKLLKLKDAVINQPNIAKWRQQHAKKA